MLEKNARDTYDLILERDVLTNIGFNILYESSKFMWYNIQVDMVPRGMVQRKHLIF